MTLLQRILGALVGIVLVVVGLVFAWMVLVVAAALALVIWGWLWWRTRELRRAVERGERRGGVIVEGEYRVEREERRIGERDEDGPSR
jgi:ABC-type bacteriocin/lantibiotic exporter with double-glycine peptidase domain